MLQLFKLNIIQLIFLIIIIIINITIVLGGKDRCPKVKISTGELQSDDDKESRNDRDFCVYRGIPYAKPPIGPLRFEPPVPPSNWTGIKKLDDYSSPCIQFSSSKNEIIGKEDCLFINVFTPLIGNEFSKKLLPVMVYIHGGFFMTGSADNYRPHYFMDEDVVIVTFNYRLGAFGFLNTEDGLIRGNMGLKDQVMALKWIQKNIKVFGGDNTKITIFGQGAGGASVHYHLLSQMSKGLFHKAISQSGSAIRVWSFQPKPKQIVQNLIKHINCNIFLKNNTTTTKIHNTTWQEQNGTTIVNCLKKLNGSDIVKIYKESLSTVKNHLYMLAPSVEITHKYDNDTFLTEHPFSIMISGRQQRIPWIVGTNSEEGLYTSADIIHRPELMSGIENHWNEFSPQILQYNPYRTDITQRIREFYFSDYTGLQQAQTQAQTQPQVQHHPQPRPPLNKTSVVVIPSKNITIIQPVTNPGQPLQNIPLNFQDKFIKFTNLFTDRLYTYPSHKSILIQSKYSPVYVYYNNYKGEYSFANDLAKKSSGSNSVTSNPFKKASNWFKTKVLGKEVQGPKEPESMGVSHGDENLLLFKYPDAKIKSDAKDYKMSRDLVKIWTQFAYDDKSMKFGENITWPQVTLKNVTSQVGAAGGNKYMYNVLRLSNSNSEIGMISNPIHERMQFWESLEYLPPYQE